jgi:transposase
MNQSAPNRRVPRREYSRDFKRQVAQQSLSADATVTQVAKDNNIPEGCVWRWRREYAAGKYGKPSEKVSLLPVGIATPPEEAGQVDVAADVDNAATPVPNTSTSAGYLELYMGSVRLMIHGSPDRQVIKDVIEVLR